MIDGLAETERWGSENLREEYRDCFNQSVQGTKKRMLGGKYPEEKYITRFRRRQKLKESQRFKPVISTVSLYRYTIEAFVRLISNFMIFDQDLASDQMGEAGSENGCVRLPEL
jgi:hypothetical protein